MNTGNNSRPPGAAEPLDEQDFLVLHDVREVYEAIDPMPAELLDNIRFSIAVRDLGMEIARAPADLLAVVTRGENDRRLISLESPSMTITIGLRVDDDGTVRFDGWLSPRGAHTVELHTPDGTWTTESDQRGRFVLDHLPRTTAYLTVRTGTVVVTTPTIGL